MLTVEECLDKFSDFERRCVAKRSEQIDRIKEDREFLSGEQWDKNDSKLIAKSRPRRTVNVLGNSVHSVVNHYANYPYKWYSNNEKANAAGDAFLKIGNNARAALDVLESSTSFGLGYFCLGSETKTNPVTGQSMEIPALYSMDKVENVYFDPDSIDNDGADAVEAAIVEMRSKNYVRAKYGEEWVTDKGVPPVVNVSDNKSVDTMVIVTYFVVEDGFCTVYRLLNDRFLDEPVQLNLDRVPVFPVYGERTWNDGDIIYQGIVRKGMPIQKILNYAFTQLAERMAQAPKPTWLTTPQAVEGYDEGYRNFANNLNPLLLWNKTSDKGKTVNDPPQRMDNRVQFDDITAIIGSNLELLSTITGVDARGMIEGKPDLTATEVIYNERQVQTTIRHYFSNLRDTFKAVGEAVLKLLGYGDVMLEVIQGPSEYMEKQVARQELITLAGFVPEQDKMKLVDGVLLSHNDNVILRNVFGSLHSTPQQSETEIQALQTVEVMKQAIQEKDQRLIELEDTVKRYEQAQANNDKTLRADFAKKEMEHRFHQEDMILQAQLDQGKDADKAALDVQKAQIELKKEAVQLDAATVKADADIIKTRATTAAQLMGALNG